MPPCARAQTLSSPRTGTSFSRRAGTNTNALVARLYGCVREAATGSGIRRGRGVAPGEPAGARGPCGMAVSGTMLARIANATGFGEGYGLAARLFALCES